MEDLREYAKLISVVRKEIRAAAQKADSLTADQTEEYIVATAKVANKLARWERIIGKA